jgi:DNA-binding response OmpR family regulator
VGYLRRKLLPETPAEAPIETVRGFGYRYVT